MNQQQPSTTPRDNAADRSVTLVLPGLLDLPAVERETAYAQVGAVSELECFFSRATREDFLGANIESTLFSLFNVELHADKDVPVGPVAYVGDEGQLAGQWCLCADPVQLIPDRDQLLLLGPESLSLSQAEADHMISELNAHFVEEGWRIEACTPTRWYLHLSQAPGLRTYSLAQVRARAIGDYLPSGAYGKQWHGVMNEVQMVLHNSEVNRERQAVGQPTVNSLWFWGSGELPAIQHSRWSKVWSNEALSLGLATLSSTPRKPLAKNANTWLNEVVSPGEHLIIIDNLLSSWQQGDLATWAQQVRALNDEWIVPLLKALRGNEINELTVCTCNGNKFSLSRAGLRRWWRRKKTLASMAERD